MKNPHRLLLILHHDDDDATQLFLPVIYRRLSTCNMHGSERCKVKDVWRRYLKIKIK